MRRASLLVDASAVRAILARVGRDALMDGLITRLTDAIAAFDPAIARVPVRAGVQYMRPAFGLLEWMPAYLGDSETLVKVVGYHPTNPDLRGVPTVISTMGLFDTESGHLAGIVDGTFLTALRTGAASAVASRVLGSPGSRTLGVIGCGAQAVTQIHALTRIFPLERVLAYDIKPEVASTLANRVRFLNLRIETVTIERLAALVAESDILCTCTSAAPGEGPVFADGPTRGHLHVNAVGSDFPGKFELPRPLLRRAFVCPDFREQATVEGECQQLDDSGIGPDLCALVQAPGRYEAERARVTVFDSTGWALEDHVAARMTFELAREFGVGREIELECLPPDPKDPYSVLEASSEAVAAWLPVAARL